VGFGDSDRPPAPAAEAYSAAARNSSCEPGGGSTVEIFDLVDEIDRLGCPEHAGRSMLQSLMDTDVNVRWMG